MRGAGGSPGGIGQFSFGAVLAGVGPWLLLDSVRATTAPHGLVSEDKADEGPLAAP